MKDDRVYLKHVLRCIARIEEYTATGRESFFSSHLIQDGVIRNLQTLAESSQRLSESIKESYADVDWKGLAGFRNVLVHDYRSSEGHQRRDQQRALSDEERRGCREQNR